jgi:hypothetical protein
MQLCFDTDCSAVKELKNFCTKLGLCEKAQDPAQIKFPGDEEGWPSYNPVEFQSSEQQYISSLGVFVVFKICIKVIR